jgi:uncharacterized protein YbjT (DUF2867 family)
MILVTGATGNIGKELIPLLFESGQSVRVLVRDERKVSHLDPHIERAVGDLDKPDTLQATLRGVDRIFLVTYETRQDIHVLEAAKQAGVNSVVKVSTLEASRSYLLVGRWHREREELIEASGLEWTFLRPGMFMSNSIQWWAETIKAQGRVYFPGGKGQVAPVAPRDVAAVAAVALTRPEHASKIYELTGPELLTIDDMAQIIGIVIGRQVKYVNVPMFAARLQMLMSGMDGTLVKALMQVASELRNNKGAVLTKTVEGVTGRPAQTFDAWCREHASAFQLQKPETSAGVDSYTSLPR